MRTLERLTELARRQGGLLADLVLAEPRWKPASQQPGPAAALAGGPRVQRDRERYELLVEAIYEGYLLHYGSARVIACDQDDLRLLAGDRLYALGLSLIVELDDVEAVAELSDLITIVAQAQQAGEQELAAASWSACVHAIGWGASERHRHAKQLALKRSPEALAALRASAAV